MDKIDTYQKYLNFLNNSNDKPSLLLQCCCAPCSTSVIEQLIKNFNITLYYYNPNTYPYEEYEKRYEQFEKMNSYNLNIIKEYYNHFEFSDRIKGLEKEKEGGKRCFVCYRIRLERTAKKAKEMNFDYFSSTLSVSPYKNSKELNDIGQEIASIEKIPFLYSDFKKKEGYKISINLSKKYNLYRQEYCGCEFSLQESKENKKLTYRELLKNCQEYGLENDAFILLITELSGILRRDLVFHLDEYINNDLLRKINNAIDLYKNKHIPAQYILGYTYFYGLKIKVNSNVLIPRFDTEEVVEKVIEELKQRKNPKVLDLCCGSGCIALAIKKNVSNAIVHASDISNEAIDIAKMNCSDNNLDVKFILSDLFNNINESYDVIVSNPPYISKDEVIDELVYNNEPHLALFSENNGLYHYEEILKNVKNHLNENGIIFFEISSLRRKEMIELVSKYFINFEIYKDLNNKDRIMKIWR